MPTYNLQEIIRQKRAEQEAEKKRIEEIVKKKKELEQQQKEQQPKEIPKLVVNYRQEFKNRHKVTEQIFKERMAGRNEYLKSIKVPVPTRLILDYIEIKEDFLINKLPIGVIAKKHGVGMKVIRNILKEYKIDLKQDIKINVEYKRELAIKKIDEELAKNLNVINTERKKELAKELRVARKFVQAVLKERNVKIRRGKYHIKKQRNIFSIDNVVLDSIIKMYLEGYSLRECARRFSYGIKKLRRNIFQQLGYIRPNKGSTFPIDEMILAALLKDYLTYKKPINKIQKKFEISNYKILKLLKIHLRNQNQDAPNVAKERLRKLPEGFDKTNDRNRIDTYIQVMPFIPTQEQIDIILNKYNNGTSILDLSKEFNLNRKRMGRLIKKYNNGEVRKRGKQVTLSKKLLLEDNNIKREYEGGATVLAISKELNVSPQTIVNALARKRVVSRRTNQVFQSQEWFAARKIRKMEQQDNFLPNETIQENISVTEQRQNEENRNLIFGRNTEGLI